ncbi:glucose/arabinose dehydrogenase [Actinoalloteichus hoggarensis]|uniref:ThuA domain-containing protein n=1 Tax=Actinoalloteichus hoggarensis TaxID=1470176 RepID=UPI0017B4ED64|nr:ThuA domain-containing protein [Actinoalloteichus hoggarensis]MBB5922972.1 glucose/arabinose dehydrogenase [Actinoalloteichus hoggarensis]
MLSQRPRTHTGRRGRLARRAGIVTLSLLTALGVSGTASALPTSGLGARPDASDRQSRLDPITHAPEFAHEGHGPGHGGTPPGHGGTPPGHGGTPPGLGDPPDHGSDEEFDALVFSKTAGFRHDSIPAGIAAIEQLGEENGFTVTATEDAGAFTDDNLAQYEVVVWLSTTGDVLNDEQQGAFERYIQGGGGYAGVHAASDTEYGWPWYGDLVGAYFDSHPHIQEATVTVEDHDHPSSAHLPDEWVRTDEWYNYQENPREDVHVLASLDESSYDPGSGAMGDHPIAWCHEFDGGRSWYTGGGHTIESFSEPEFLQHLAGGIQSAAGAVDANCGGDHGGHEPDPEAPVDEDFDQITLAKGDGVTGEPMGLAVLPDRRVLHTSRHGEIFLTTPEATTTLAGRLPVYNHDEDGLQGVAIDPDFEENQWVYLYYAPVLDTPAGDAPTTGTAEDFAAFEGHNQLSRFKLLDDGTLDIESEQEILQVAADRGICCHAGGEIDFDSQGNLLLSTGDDTNPFESSNYTPIDERADRNPAFDAQRSSANTNDLRGKVLRITVQEDGSYTIPEGNLFPEGTEQTRPEIYAMGLRNPFRFAVDPVTDWIYLGDYGPDAGSADPNRGPAGIVEFNLITGPSNLGWPYCVGDNEPFIDYDFASGTSGEAFDCAAPQNTSPNNTGLVDLPPAQPAWIPYDGGSVPEFGNGGESPMGGPVYRFDPELDVDTKFPEYYDGKNFAYEWDRGWIKTIDVGENGEPGAIAPFFDSMELTRPMNIEFGPDGSLYVLDYGSGYFGGAPDSAVYRIDYTQGGRTPSVQLSADVTSGPTPLTVEFDPTGTVDPDGQELTYEWDFDGDGTVDSTEAGPVSHTYTETGQFQARLAVTDTDGLTGAATVTITAGNTAPIVELEYPVDGGVFAFGGQVPFKVTVTDPEDSAAGGIDCSRVVVEYILGHDNHGHPISRETGCEGTITTAADDGHGADANIFGVIDASYVDGGAEGAPALGASDQNILHTKSKEAEFFHNSEGVSIIDTHAGSSGGRQVGNIENGDWISLDPVNLHGVDGIGYRVSSDGAGGSIEVRSGAPDGELLQTVEVANTGGWNEHVEIEPTPVTDPGGSQELFFVFVGGEGALFDLDVIRFDGPGVTEPGGTEPGEPGCEPTTPEEGYRSLFDGTQASLDGWNQAGPGEFVLQDDCSILSTGGMGLLWHGEELGSYSFKADWKMAGDDNSGVFVGFPDPGDDPWVAVNEGYEIQIDATDVDDRTTGAIYTFQGADLEARDAALNPPGEWNSYEIVVEGQTIKVYLNDVLINDFLSTDANRDLTSGFVGIQNHGDGDDVYFRDIQVADIVDETAPVTTLSTDPAEADGAEGWFTSTPLSVSLSADDEGSGVASTEYRIDDGEWTEYSEPFAVAGDGTHTVEYRSTDVAGNVEDTQSVELRIDATEPLTEAALAAPNDNGWHAGDVAVELSASDEASGVARIEWSLNGGDWTEYDSAVEISGDGEHTLLYRAVDTAGNVEAEKAATVLLDATAPTLLLAGVADGRVYGDATDLFVSWEVHDSTSGVDSVIGTLNGEEIRSGRLVPLYQLPFGTHEIAVHAVDRAGNTAEQSVTFATTTSLRDIGQLVDRFRATNRLSLTAHRDLTEQLVAARLAEATGDDWGAIEGLRSFAALAEDTALVSDAEVRTVLVRDAEAVIASIEGVAVLAKSVNAE